MMATTKGLVEPGQLVNDRWQVIKKIGIGSFSEIFEAFDAITNDLVALKAESVHQVEQVMIRILNF